MDKSNRYDVYKYVAEVSKKTDTVILMLKNIAKGRFSIVRNKDWCYSYVSNMEGASVCNVAVFDAASVQLTLTEFLITANDVAMHI